MDYYSGIGVCKSPATGLTATVSKLHHDDFVGRAGLSCASRGTDQRCDLCMDLRATVNARLTYHDMVRLSVLIRPLHEYGE